MITRMAAAWFGHFDRNELIKYLLSAVIFFLIIGTYWLLSITRDAVFKTMIGWEFQPYAKMISGCVAFPLVIGYSALADRFVRHRLFYVLSAVYIGLAALFYLCLKHPSIGITNTIEDPTRILGWLYFMFVESFGSIMVALFWAFAADISTPDSAKRGYFLIALFGQAGAIVFALGVQRYVAQVGTAHVLAVALASIACIPLLVYTLVHVMPSHQLAGYQADAGTGSTSQRAKLGESIKLVMREPYLLGIFGIISLFEIVLTMFEFRFKDIASQAYAGEDFASFLASFSVYVNAIAFGCLLGGAGKIGRRLGLTASLALLPILLIGNTCVLWYYATLQAAFWVMVTTKAFNFALTQPSKEQLFIPTTYDAKYKSKVFIDLFGSRGAKGLGSYINSYKATLGTYMFTLLSTYMSLGLCAVWFVITLYLGKRHKQAVENNEYVC